MSLNSLAALASVLVAALSLIVAIVAFMRSNRSKEVEDAKELESRMTRLEERVAVLPTNKDITALSTAIQGVVVANAELGARVEGAISGIRDTLARIERGQARHEDILSRG